MSMSTGGQRRRSSQSRSKQLPDVEALWETFLEALGGKSGLRAIQGATEQQLTGIIAEMGMFSHLEQAMVYTRLLRALTKGNERPVRKKRVPSQNRTKAIVPVPVSAPNPRSSASRRPQQPEPTRRPGKRLLSPTRPTSKASRALASKKKQPIFQSKYADKYAEFASPASSSSSSLFSSSSRPQAQLSGDTRGLSTATLRRKPKAKPVVFKLKNSKYEDLGVMPRPKNTGRGERDAPARSKPELKAAVPVFRSKLVESEADAIFARMQISEGDTEGEVDPEYKQEEEFRAFIAEQLTK
jgi:hypothetical protein